MPAATDALTLDNSSTPEKEAEDFENSDDASYRKIKIEQAHKIDIIKLEQGKIGTFIGSGESASINFCFFLAVGLLLIIVLLGVGVAYATDQFVEPMKYAITALLTISGYIFGKKT